MSVRFGRRAAGCALAAATAPLLASCGGSGHVVGRAPCTWRAQRSGPRTTDDLTDVSFPDARHGWAVGGIDRPVIRATADAGRHWRVQRAPGREGLASVSFADARHGWAVGVDDTLLVTTDGGATWRRGDPGLRDGNLYSVRFVDREHGWIAGAKGVIRATTDGGRTWTVQDSGTRLDLDDLDVVDRQHAWVVAGHGEVLRTADGGRTWRSVYSGSTSKDEVVVGLSFLGARPGWESGSRDDGDATHGVVSATTDGGATWHRHVATNLEDVRFGPVAFVDAQRGWAGGYLGQVLYSDDGGADWAERPSPTDGHRLEAMTFHDARHGWGVGEEGTIAACAP